MDITSLLLRIDLPADKTHARVIYLTEKGEVWYQEEMPVYMKTYQSVIDEVQFRLKQYQKRSLGWLATKYQVEWV